jgi:hypothetical protein
MLPFGSCNVGGPSLCPANWFVEVALLYNKATSTNHFAGHTGGQRTLHEPNGSIRTAWDTPDDGPKKTRNM